MDFETVFFLETQRGAATLRRYVYASPCLALASSARFSKPCSLVTSAFLAARVRSSPWVATSSRRGPPSHASAKATNAFPPAERAPRPRRRRRRRHRPSRAPPGRARASARAARSASAERDRATGSVAFVSFVVVFVFVSPACWFPPRELEENSAALARRISSICASCCCRARARFDASVSRSMSFAVGFTPRPPTVSSGAGSRPLKSRRCVVASRSPAATHASSFALSHVVSG